jgi:hypothetical protein
MDLFHKYNKMSKRVFPRRVQGIIPAEPDVWVWLGDMAYLDVPLVDCSKVYSSKHYISYFYDQFVSRFVLGRTNRVRALRADRDTAPAAERIVGNEMGVKLSVTRQAASEAAFAAGCAGRADRERTRLALQASSNF